MSFKTPILNGIRLDRIPEKYKTDPDYSHEAYHLFFRPARETGFFSLFFKLYVL